MTPKTTGASSKHRFIAYECSLELIQTLRPILKALRNHDADLTRQLKRAAASISLNLAEGRRRFGKDRTHLFRIASGSASEVKACLEVAHAFGYVEAHDLQPAFNLLDRMLAMLWRLARS